MRNTTALTTTSTSASPAAGAAREDLDVELSPALQRALGRDGAFDAVLGLAGEVFRQHKHRRTIRVELGGRGYFVKIHGHTQPVEILKNALRGRWPVLTAQAERDAIRRLEQLDIATLRVAGYGCRGIAPTHLESFLITDALDETVALSDLTRDWGGLTGRARRRLVLAVITRLADIASRLHANGLNHRDFYLCHFLVPARDWATWEPGEPFPIHVIDLHRAQIRSRVPRRWVVKDLAGLLFSALDAGLSTHDYVRFAEVYFGRPWREIVHAERHLLQRVTRRAIRQYRAQHGRSPRLPGSFASFA